MKPFSTIAIPHRDILEGRLTMDVFAADRDIVKCCGLSVSSSHFNHLNCFLSKRGS